MNRSQTLLHIVDRLLGADALAPGPEMDCPYLRGRRARQRGFLADRLDPEIYHALMDRRFRRSGNLFYQPACRNCHECVPLRVPVEAFVPSRSQRRVWRANLDVQARLGVPELTHEKWQLYARYLADQHDHAMSDAYEDLQNFLYRSPVNTVEVCYRAGHNLLGVSIADRSSQSLSSVYMFFDPAEARRSLGTFSILWEIEYCRRQGIPYYYLGFMIEGCGKMSYKANFGPHERMAEDFGWHAGASR